MTHADRLATRIISLAPAKPDPITHLKLQKLAFYAFGACLAFDLEEAVGSDISFEAWEHGPVCRPIWRSYRQCGGSPIPPPDGAALPYSAEVELIIRDVVDIYGLLSAWQIRQESHLEEPWRRAWEKREPIPNESLRKHFTQKFRTGPVRLPSYLVNAQSAALDGIPPQDYGSFSHLAAAARLLRSP